MPKRRASRAVQARERARAHTAELREREALLEDLATRWFEADAERVEVEAAAEKKIDAYAARVRGQTRRDTGRLGDEMSTIVREMLQLTGIRSVTERLGVVEAVVRDAKAEQAAARADPATGPSTESSQKAPTQPTREQTKAPESEGRNAAVPD
ncbi:hypothetical protein [Streptomyces sp. B6B3]|uniref:hypothetical protein n=1 Tax=Streptomyces sp. B6B3 TaxID=3153570 RepID=UPI00325D8A73